MRCLIGLFLGILFALLGSCLDASRAHATPKLSADDGLREMAADPVRSSDRSAVDALAREIESMPEGETRVRADLFLGQLYATRFVAPAQAALHFRRASESPSAGADPLTRRMAQGGLVDALLATGKRSEARAVSDASGDTELGRRVGVAVRRHALHVASVSAVALFALLASISTVVAARGRSLRASLRSLPRFAHLALAFSAWLGATGALLAHNYDAASPLPFIALALTIVPIALVARVWSLVGRPAAWARAGRALLAANAALAAAFLVLETIDTNLLSGFGL